jgi:hypothetical protein
MVTDLRNMSFVCSFIKGFITRNGQITEVNKAFVELAKAQYLIRLSKNLPTSLLDKSWPPHPVVCREVIADHIPNVGMLKNLIQFHYCEA